MTAISEDRLQQLRRAGAAVLHHADSPGQRSRIARTQVLNPCLDFWIQTAQCKAGAGQDGTSKDLGCGSVRETDPYSNITSTERRGNRTSHSGLDREHWTEASSKEDL